MRPPRTTDVVATHAAGINANGTRDIAGVGKRMAHTNEAMAAGEDGEAAADIIDDAPQCAHLIRQPLEMYECWRVD